MKQKWIIYFEEPGIEDINRVIERWFGVAAKIDYSTLLEMKSTGVLNKNQQLEVFLDDLKWQERYRVELMSRGCCI